MEPSVDGCEFVWGWDEDGVLVMALMGYCLFSDDFTG